MIEFFSEHRSLSRTVAFVLGALVAVVGFFIGLSSHQVTYQRIDNTYIQHYISGDSSNNYTSYVALSGSSLLFVVNERDFSPTLSGTALGDGHVSLIYNPEENQNIDITSTSGTHLKGLAYTIIALTALDSGSQTFVTGEYSQSPTGAYINRWPIGYGFWGAAALICLLSLFFGEHILNVIVTTIAGAVIAPLLVFLYVGFFIGDTSGGSWSQALNDNLVIVAIAGAIGAVIGFIVGIVQIFQQ